MNLPVCLGLLLILLFGCQSKQKYNQYENGKKEGEWHEYHSNGNLKSSVIYKNGIKQGIAREWWENGNMSSFGTYVDGKANGMMTWYNMDGEGHIAGKGNMVNGKRDGIWKICDIHDETACVEASFSMDKKDGPWNLYYENGQLSQREIWKNDMLVSKECWDTDGKTITC